MKLRIPQLSDCRVFDAGLDRRIAWQVDVVLHVRNVLELGAESRYIEVASVVELKVSAIGNVRGL